MGGSPWGPIQSSTQVTEGVRWVSTAGHGGLMVRLDIAAGLSDLAWGIAADYAGVASGCLCFEEDCDYAAAFAERPEWARMLDERELVRWPTFTEPYLVEARPRRMAELRERLARTDEQQAEHFRTIITRYRDPEARAACAERGATLKRRYARPRPHPAVTFDAYDCGGVFDGARVLSDADPGL